MNSTQTEKSTIAKEIAVLGLAALSFFGGCSANNRRDDFLDARASSAVKADSTEQLVNLKGFAERKVVSLSDASSNFVSLDPRVDYLVEVPFGTFKEVSQSIVKPSNSWSSAFKTDDIYIFEVPKNPSQYAVKIESQDWCKRGGWDEYDGTYLLLLNMAEGARTESAVKFPLNSNFTSQAKNHGQLVLIRSAEDGKIFEVPTPRLLFPFRTSDRHRLPGYVRQAHDQIVQRQEREKL
jgi:hypothetical protein